MSRQTVFITGVAGKIGSLLLDSLYGKEYLIRALFQDEASSYKNQEVQSITGDLLEPESFAFALQGVTTVIHLAGITHTNDISRYYRVNSYGTLQLLRLCKRYGVKRFIFISTRAICEDGGHYSRSKRIAEKYVQESGLEWVVLRLGEVYGTKGTKGIDAVLHYVDRFPVVPVIGNGQYSVMPIYVADAVLSIVKVLEREDLHGRIYTIAGPEVLTYNELIDKIMAVKMVRKIKLHIPFIVTKILTGIAALITNNSFLVNDQLPRLCCKKSNDISLAIAELGFAPAKIEDVIRLQSL